MNVAEVHIQEKQICLSRVCKVISLGNNINLTECGLMDVNRHRFSKSHLEKGTAKLFCKLRMDKPNM